MSNPIIQRINTIEREMVSEMDLSHIARERVEPDLPSCCEYHGMADGGCNEGRACPERDAAYRASPQGYESALPVQFLGDEPKPVRRISFGAVAFFTIAASVVFFVYLIATRTP
jgi:hypothetical protein